ncbi:glucosaminidase domain-containing protein [Paenibacillus ferrarius]|uniref:glucosaminidase domain-containing protein n=1 Tax=Paenibacillus ferrarius TaxID=1469647 RepID=UPI003D2B76CD
MEKVDWWNKAKEAGLETGWFPTVILAQWQLETGNFTSANLLNNNNIAGQTWQPYMGTALKGTARPAAEGGYYIKYVDPVVGYVDFIKKNRRYAGVRLQSSEEGQIRAIAAAGWAVDPAYAEKLISILNRNKTQGFTLKEEDLSMVLNFDEDWQWKQLGDSLDGLYRKGLISDYKWVERAYTRRMSFSELAWINTVVAARQNGIEV